ncbi:MAG TPA: hypothetical protein VM890_02540 [Longimicrobium sp.]|jgi:hypothetical protein|nr:hypothetical protein [Longimicrobium sp.]
MRLSHLTRFALVLAACAACTDERTPTGTPGPDPDPPKAPTPVGVYEIAVTGIGTDDMGSTIRSVRPIMGEGMSASMAAVGSGIGFELVSSGSFVEGSRTGGGQRYLTFAYRVRNGTGVSLNNLTMVMAQRPVNIPGTPLSVLKKFDGTNADTAIAKYIVPTGVATMGSDLVTMQSPYPDVLQVFTEAEVAAVTPTGDITGLFPYGYVVRNASSTTNRTLPATADPNQWDGVLTLSFRVPLQATSALDAYSLTFQVMGVTDTETRMTESIEEAQDTAAVRRIRDRATALGATTVTVLNGSTVMDAAVPDYPGQRQICSPRTAGTAASPVTNIVTPGAYSYLMILRTGETMDPCAAYFRGGFPGRPSLNVPYFMTVKAVDRYGNVKTAQADTVHLTETSGPPVVFGGTVALSSGSATLSATYSDYGLAQMVAVGRRIHGDYPITVAGVTRVWTAGAGTTDWHTNNNWNPQAVPGTLDSVYIPVAAPLDPVLAANVTIMGVTVEDVATIGLNAFDLTANASVTAGLTGGITNTTGRLILGGTAMTVQGRLPRLRVTGTYSLTGNVNARAPIEVSAGRLTNGTYRLQADGY